MLVVNCPTLFFSSTDQVSIFWSTIGVVWTDLKPELQNFNFVTRSKSLNPNFAPRKEKGVNRNKFAILYYIEIKGIWKTKADYRYFLFEDKISPYFEKYATKYLNLQKCMVLQKNPWNANFWHGYICHIALWHFATFVSFDLIQFTWMFLSLSLGPKNGFWSRYCGTSWNLGFLDGLLE